MDKKKIFIIIGVLAILAVLTLVLTNLHSSKTPYSISPTSSVGSSSASMKESDQIKNRQIITLTDAGFDPTEVIVEQGAIVQWINKSSKDATVNSGNYPTNLLYPPLNLGKFASGSAVSLIFDKPGTYSYYNYFNQDQKGIIKVN